jgi:hypothetical protein
MFAEMKGTWACRLKVRIRPRFVPLSGPNPLGLQAGPQKHHTPQMRTAHLIAVSPSLNLIKAFKSSCRKEAKKSHKSTHWNNLKTWRAARKNGDQKAYGRAKEACSPLFGKQAQSPLH